MGCLYSPSCREGSFSATYLWQPFQVCNFPCVGICHLSNKRASLKEAKRDVNRGFDCFSYLEQGQHRSNRRKGAVETWQKRKPSA